MFVVLVFVSMFMLVLVSMVVLMLMLMLMLMFMLVMMLVPLRVLTMVVVFIMMMFVSVGVVMVRMGMCMFDAAGVSVLMRMLVREVNVKFHALNRRFLGATAVKMKVIKAQLLQLMLELVKVHAQINQRPDEHVTADAAENIQIKRLHVSIIREGRVPPRPRSILSDCDSLNFVLAT
jgi:hypothetical protein